MGQAGMHKIRRIEVHWPIVNEGERLPGASLVTADVILGGTV